MLAAPTPNRYTAAADLIENLADAVIVTRVRLRLSATAAARQIGIGKSTMVALESGSAPSQSTILLTLRWLART